MDVNVGHASSGHRELFIPGIFWGGGISPETYNFPQVAAKSCAVNLFQLGHELQIYHGNFLLMDNKHMKLFTIKQSKGCRFVPKCSGIRLAAGSALTHWAGLCAPPDPLATMGAFF